MPTYIVMQKTGEFDEQGEEKEVIVERINAGTADEAYVQKTKAGDMYIKCGPPIGYG